jgi:hypothetical protein
MEDDFYRVIKDFAQLRSSKWDRVVSKLVKEISPHQLDALHKFVELLKIAATRPRVFMSHSSTDKKFVRDLANYLKRRHLQVWVDEAEMDAGASLSPALKKAIAGGDVVVAVLSPEAVASRWVAKELRWAMTRPIADGGQVHVIPIMKKHCTVPSFLANRRRLDFTTDSKVRKNRPVLLRSILNQLS